MWVVHRYACPWLYTYDIFYITNIREHHVITIDQGLVTTYMTDKAVTGTITLNAKLLDEIL